jgi:hypothetical protein
MHQTGRCAAAQLLIDGKFVPSKSGKTFKTINPVVCPCWHFPLSVMQAARHLSTTSASQLARPHRALQTMCPIAGRVGHHRDLGGRQGRCRRCGGRRSQGVRQGALAPHVSRCFLVVFHFILGMHGLDHSATIVSVRAIHRPGICDQKCCNRLRHFVSLQDGRAAGAHHQQVCGPAGGQSGGAGAAGDAGDASRLADLFALG